MNNLKYYNDSLAYDFEMFMPKTAANPSKKDNIVVMPKVAAANRKRKKAAVKTLSSPMMFLMCGIMILAAFCGNIALRLEINEVSAQIKSVKSQIAELDSEKTSLEVEMQRRISFSNLELEAVKLGMSKPTKENITYIRVNDKNAAKTTDGTFICEE